MSGIGGGSLRLRTNLQPEAPAALWFVINTLYEAMGDRQDKQTV
jgi:hypothetical protein